MTGVADELLKAFDGDPAKWMVSVAEARMAGAGPRDKVVNLKFTRATLDMWLRAMRECGTVGRRG